MSTKLVKCANTFFNFLRSRESYYDAFQRLGFPRAFDVTLKDSLQSLPFEEQQQFTDKTKNLIFHTNLRTYRPYASELGALTDAKLIPAMKDNFNYFKQTYNQLYHTGFKSTQPYIYVSNQKQLHLLMEHNLMHYLSFGISLTDSFQNHCTKQTVEQASDQLASMVRDLDLFCYKREVRTFPYPRIKLSVNCVAKCPFEGTLDINRIVDSVAHYYHTIKPDLLCLKDTTGTLTPEELSIIVKKCLEQRVPSPRLGLHIHLLPNGEENAKALMNTALTNKVSTFDVSSFSVGGCPRMHTNYPRNITYDFFYDTIVNRIMKDCSINK